MKTSLIKYDWKEDYKVKTECYDGEFGHNCEFSFKKHFEQFEKKFPNSLYIQDEYTIEINLPPNPVECLIWLMTKLPSASLASYNKTKNKLTLEFHY